MGIAIIIPFVPRVDSGWYLVIPLAITGCGLGLLVSQLNNYTLAPVEEERVSEAAGVNSAAGSFGLSFGLAMAGGIMLAALSVSFTQMTENSEIIPAAQQEQIAAALEDDAEVMSNTQLEQQITGQPPAVEAEVVAINNDARNISLQIALLVPLLAGLLGLVNSFRMLRLPDQKPVLSRRDGLRLTRMVGQVLATPAHQRSGWRAPASCRRSGRPRWIPCLTTKLWPDGSGTRTRAGSLAVPQADDASTGGLEATDLS